MTRKEFVLSLCLPFVVLFKRPTQTIHLKFDRAETGFIYVYVYENGERYSLSDEEWEERTRKHKGKSPFITLG